MTNDWYKKMSFYQIWIRSFCDGNGDGIGDLYGVYEKLEYIKSLGVDGIWFSPIYPSPNADYGYDISDYKNIHPEYGDLDQFKKVLDKAHELGLKVIMDLVVNHTSDEHPWFLESKKGKDNPYSDYYIWRDGKGDKLPNNWDSLFEGKAWEYCEERGQYYLHIFAKKQPDLNMDNPKVRREVESILRFWLDMGVDGFREDVITFISKKEGLPNGPSFIPMANGMPFYKDGPHIHEYMRQFRKVCEEYDCFQLGEAPMTDVKTALLYTSGKHKSLDMMFHFDHMMADCFLTEYIHRPFNLLSLKKAFSKWQVGLYKKSWNALYLENHDHPRIISRYGSEKYWRESGTMLAASYLFQQGTPFIYQGQEIGMTNIRLKNIMQYKDVSSITNYHKFHVKDSEEKRMARIHASSRDSSRTPMQWTDEEYAGFSSARPWFYVNPNYRKVNVRKQEDDPKSILNFYRTCLKYRKEHDVVLWGSYKEYDKKNKDLYIYERSYKDEKVLVVCSFAKHDVEFTFPEELSGYYKKLAICNYELRKKTTDHFENEKIRKHEKISFGDERLHPYETRVYELKKE